jgi:hypothetical protein
VLPAAIRNIKQTKSYPQTFKGAREIFKECIGFLLLRLIAGQAKPSDWRVFDQLLRQLYAGGEI